MLQHLKIRGMIQRRILINFRVDPEVLARQLPAPFQVQRVGEYGLAGICLIRLGQVRPAFWPWSQGWGSENAAHRIAVTWPSAGQTHTGVYIPRRDTSSRLNTWLGGRLFPGVHHRATFVTRESDGEFDCALRSDDGQTGVAIEATVAEQWPSDSVFASVDEAVAFFRGGAVGYSPGHGAGEFDGLELVCQSYAIEPLAVRRVVSSFFDDRQRFPAGSIEFDSALLMQQIDHCWQARPRLVSAGCC